MAYTHVIEYDGGKLSMELSPRRDITVFSQTLRKFNGVKPWEIALWEIPSGLNYEAMRSARELPSRYIQAGGTAEAMTIELRKPAILDGGVESARYVLGHSPGDDGPPAVPITLGGKIEMVCASEVFNADEAAQIFFDYYQSGEISTSYRLRPVQGWTAQGESIQLPL